jgi:hypothetical protein
MKKIILFAVLMISIVGCKKTSNSNNSDPAVLLSKFVELDTTQAAPNDTLEVDIYKYDNIHRWVFENDIDFNDGFPGIRDSAYEYTNTNFYAGTATVPYLNISTESQSEVLQTTDNDYLLSFSPQGLLLKDSVVETSPSYPLTTTIYNNTYSGSEFTQVSLNLSNPNNPSYDTSKQTKLNNNIITQVNQRSDDDNFTASYDTHPSPFPDSYLVYLTSFAWIGTDNVDFGQKNNLTQIQGLILGLHYQYQYTYNANGYPATVIEYDLSSGSPVFVYKGIYVY